MGSHFSEIVPQKPFIVLQNQEEMQRHVEKKRGLVESVSSKYLDHGYKSNKSVMSAQISPPRRL